MFRTGKIRLRLSSEAKTLIGLLVLLACFFVWLDFRDESHEEITEAECAELNKKWRENYQTYFSMNDELNVQEFKCPSSVSGMARGLQFLEDTGLPNISAEEIRAYWSFILDMRPQFGQRPGGRFLGRAVYETNRIDIDPSILLRGDPVEIAGVLVHEVRHLQQGFNTHVICTRDAARSCDQRLEENPEQGGAYNYNVMFYHQVIQSVGIDAQKKRSAKRLLLDTLEKRFNLIKPDLRKRYEP